MWPIVHNIGLCGRLVCVLITESLLQAASLWSCFCTQGYEKGILTTAQERLVACFPSFYFKHHSQRMFLFLDFDTSSCWLLHLGLGFDMQMSLPLKCDQTKYLLTCMKQGPWLDSGMINLFDIMYVQCISIQLSAAEVKKIAEDRARGRLDRGPFTVRT